MVGKHLDDGWLCYIIDISLKAKVLNVSIIGAGNVSQFMTRQLYQAGHTILSIYNRKIRKAQKLSKEVNAKAIRDLSHIDTESELILIMISDDAIESVSQSLVKNLDTSKIIIAHTSGSTSSIALKRHKNTAVFYPLQTFKNLEKADWKDIPLLITTDKKRIQTKLQKLAGSLGLTSYIKTDKQRQDLHLSAVVMNNFVNHLFCLTKEWLDSSDSKFNLLIPLISKTIENGRSSDPCLLQTGPARRDDEKIIQTHLSKLQEFDELHNIYKLMSQSIKNRYH